MRSELQRKLYWTALGTGVEFGKYDVANGSISAAVRIANYQVIAARLAPSLTRHFALILILSYL